MTDGKSAGPLRRALVISVFVHGALLLGGQAPREPSVSVAALGKVDVLLHFAPSVTHAARGPQEEPARPLAPNHPGIPPVTAPPLSTDSALPSVSAGDPVTVPAPLPVTGPSTVEATRRGTGTGLAVYQDSKPAGHSAPQQAVDSEELRSFKLSLTKAAARYKQYPALARERGVEGVVGISVSAGEAGQDALEVSITRSSGEPVLDKAALQMMREASRAVDIPARLRGQVLRVDVPVDYRLGD